ncbi:prolipoprotein diacylglyceryl transferase [Candidatus Woesearchaeota archaeon]|nr:prolipoprotein diacylglyceryl transferase [Candidatus Woesearchaeota archaeon]
MVWIHTIDPVLISIGPLRIHWYGVMYVLAFLFAYWYVRRRIRQEKTALTLEQLDSLMVWLVVALIIGARLFEVLFWQPGYYFAHPVEILAIWKGGLSFHGSLVAMIITAYILARRFGLSLLSLGDLLIVPLSLGQAFGRMGNFINGELFGRVTSLPWGVNFGGETDAFGQLVFRHPNQLYEVAYNVVIFVVLWLLRDRGLRPGSLLAIWLILYAVFRFCTEFLRVGEPSLLGLTLGQVFNIVMCIAGSAILYYQYRQSPKPL